MAWHGFARTRAISSARRKWLLQSAICPCAAWYSRLPAIPASCGLKGSALQKASRARPSRCGIVPGNPVPDGTVVTFTETGASGKSTVDMPIKQGVARAQFLASGPAVISVASGVVMGNQLRVGAK